MKSKNRLCIKNLAGALAIPVLVAILLQGICMAKGKTMIMNMTSFDNFVVYIAIVMITTIALSINLNSGRFDFSLGSMALLSSVIGAKITYSFLGGGQGSAPIMLMLTILFGMLLGLISGVLYVVLHLPPIITSLGVTLIYEGILFTITEGRYVMKEVQNSSMTAFTGNWLYAAIIIVAVLVIIIGLFDYTKFGYDYNALKNGQKVAVNTGIKEIPNAIACYVICGGLMGIVGFLNASRNTTINGGQLNFGSISIMFEIMGDFPSNERVLESFRSKLVKEGFDVTIYEPENFETAKFDVGTFKKSYDLVIYIGNVENASNKVTNRLSWYTFWGNGNNVPWFVAERPVMFISLANPYHLIDVPMIKTYINGYSNSEYVIESVVEKIMGRSAFTGKNPVDPFCGKEYLKW